MSYRHQLRYALSGLASRDLEQASVSAARGVLRELRGVKGGQVRQAFGEILHGADAAPKHAARLRLQLAEFAVLECATRSNLLALLPLLTKEANGVLAAHRGDAAVISSLAALLSSCLARLLHHHDPPGYAAQHAAAAGGGAGGGSSSGALTAEQLCEDLLYPVIKSTFRDPEAMRVSAGSAVLLGLLQVLKAHTEQPAVLECVRRSLALMLQLAGAGSVAQRAPGVLLPGCACVEVLGLGLDREATLRLLALCLKAATASNEPWQVRRDACQTLAVLAAALQFHAPPPAPGAAAALLHHPDDASAALELLRTPAVDALVRRKPAVLQVLEAVRYDRIAAVRSTANSAWSEFASLPDPPAPASDEDASPSGSPDKARAGAGRRSGGKQRQPGRMSVVAKMPGSPPPRFVRPRHPLGEVLDFGVEVYAPAGPPPAPPRSPSPDATADAATATEQQDDDDITSSAREHGDQSPGHPAAAASPEVGADDATTCHSQPAYTVESPGASPVPTPTSAAAGGLSAFQLLGCGSPAELLQQQQPGALSALLAAAVAGGSPLRVEHVVAGRVEVGISYSLQGSPAAPRGTAASVPGSPAPTATGSAADAHMQQPQPAFWFGGTDAAGAAQQQQARMSAGGDLGPEASFAVGVAPPEEAPAAAPAGGDVRPSALQTEPQSPPASADAPGSTAGSPGQPTSAGRQRQRWRLPTSSNTSTVCGADGSPRSARGVSVSVSAREGSGEPASSRQGTPASDPDNTPPRSPTSLDVLRSVGERVQNLLESLSRQTSSRSRLAADTPSGDDASDDDGGVHDAPAAAGPPACAALALDSAGAAQMGQPATDSNSDAPVMQPSRQASPRRELLQELLWSGSASDIVADADDAAAVQAMPLEDSQQEGDAAGQHPQADAAEHGPAGNAAAAAAVDAPPIAPPSLQGSDDGGAVAAIAGQDLHAAAVQPQEHAAGEQSLHAAHDAGAAVADELLLPSGTGGTELHQHPQQQAQQELEGAPVGDDVRSSTASTGAVGACDDGYMLASSPQGLHGEAVAPPAAAATSEAAAPAGSGGLSRVDKALEKLQSLRCTLRSISGASSSNSGGAGLPVPSCSSQAEARLDMGPAAAAGSQSDGVAGSRSPGDHDAVVPVASTSTPAAAAAPSLQPLPALAAECSSGPAVVEHAQGSALTAAKDWLLEIADKLHQSSAAASAAAAPAGPDAQQPPEQQPAALPGGAGLLASPSASASSAAAAAADGQQLDAPWSSLLGSAGMRSAPCSPARHAWGAGAVPPAVAAAASHCSSMPPDAAQGLLQEQVAPPQQGTAGAGAAGSWAAAGPAGPAVSHDQQSEVEPVALAQVASRLASPAALSPAHKDCPLEHRLQQQQQLVLTADAEAAVTHAPDAGRLQQLLADSDDTLLLMSLAMKLDRLSSRGAPPAAAGGAAQLQLPRPPHEALTWTRNDLFVASPASTPRGALAPTAAAAAVDSPSRLALACPLDGSWTSCSSPVCGPPGAPSPPPPLSRGCDEPDAELLDAVLTSVLGVTLTQLQACSPAALAAVGAATAPVRAALAAASAAAGIPAHHHQQPAGEVGVRPLLVLLMQDLRSELQQQCMARVSAVPQQRQAAGLTAAPAAAYEAAVGVHQAWLDEAVGPALAAVLAAAQQSLAC